MRRTTSPTAPRVIELNWRRARADLVDSGADNATLTALDAVIGDVAAATERPPGPVGKVLVAAGGSVPLDEWLPRPPEQPATH